MARFLHIADIHLGYDRYNNRERTKDFFRAFSDVITRYAIGEAVDCVLIAGDLFEHRTIQPAVLNQAQVGLRRLREAGIPAIAIEGNHDNCPYGTTTSWLRYLSEQGDLILLEPQATEPFYEPWDGRRGGYIDLACGLRVLGSSWYGATAPQMIERIAHAIPQLPPPPGPTVLLFHHGLEGQIARYAGALRYPEVLPLKAAGVDYLALGHIHKNYTVEDWIFNPGSLEANNVEEADYRRGAYLVEITPGRVQATLQQAYVQRSIVRLGVALRGHEQLEEVEAAAIAAIDQAIAQGTLQPEQAPIVELRLQGQVGFDRLELDTRQLQQTLQTRSQALVFLLKYEVDSAEYKSPLPETGHRADLEREVFIDLLSANQVYAKRATTLATGLLELKEQQLNKIPDPQLYEFMETLLQSGAGLAETEVATPTDLDPPAVDAAD